jgi:hypothetical protein
MSHHKEKHRLKVSKIVNERLEDYEQWFESLEEALLQSVYHHGQIKIYNEYGIPVHSENRNEYNQIEIIEETYA